MDDSIIIIVIVIGIVMIVLETLVKKKHNTHGNTNTRSNSNTLDPVFGGSGLDLYGSVYRHDCLSNAVLPLVLLLLLWILFTCVILVITISYYSMATHTISIASIC